MKKGSIFILILAIIVIVVFLLLFINIPYEDIEREPYEREECNDIELKSMDEWGNTPSVCLNEICDKTESYCVDKNFWGNCVEFRDRCIHNACTKYKRTCNFNVLNIDDRGGTWRLEGHALNKVTSESKFIESVSTYVKSMDSSTISWSFTYDAGEIMHCQYKNLKPATKTICGNVVDYRDVNVTKYCKLWKKIINKC